jgi:aminoglycoside 6-adenylyltransferase
MKGRDQKLQQITDWAGRNDQVRVVLLTSSLVNPLAPVDQFSDLDIELVFADLQKVLADDQWLSEFGRVIAKIAEAEDAFDGQHAMRMVLYDDHVKVDFKLYSIPKFLEEVNKDELPEDWDIGYKVLIDKDQLTDDLKAPGHQVSLIKKPDTLEFEQKFNDFWWDMTYVIKSLARADLFYAKFMSENNMRTEYLVPIIEWYIAVEHDWNVTTNKHGRLFPKYLSAEMWQKTEATFSGSDIQDNWRALIAYADLVHELGTKLAVQLNYPYPIELENNIRQYLAFVRSE